MARVTELGRLLTRISGLLGPVKDITRVSVIANSSQSNEVLIRKRIYPYFHLVTYAAVIHGATLLFTGAASLVSGGGVVLVPEVLNNIRLAIMCLSYAAQLNGGVAIWRHQRIQYSRQT